MLDIDSLNFQNFTPDDMPTEVTHAIAEVCGVRDTIKLIDNFGGQSLIITTKKRTAIYNQIKLICPDSVDSLFEIFSGEVLTLPTRKAVLKFIVPQLKIDADMIAVLTYTYSIDRSTIYRVLKNDRDSRKAS